MEHIPTAFISYSQESEEHIVWVKEIAARLRNDGVNVKLDQWELVPGDQLTEFMEKSVAENDYVLIICTPTYKKKADDRLGGVGYEGDIITSEVFQTKNQRKFLPILRKGEWVDSAPRWIKGKYFIDLREGSNFNRGYNDLIITIQNTRESAPPIGTYKKDTFTQKRKIEEESNKEQIKIKGILVDEVSEPDFDGTRGSALYKIPFELNKEPDYIWCELFREIWDRPPKFTQMHRPGIGYVSGNKIILDRTTIKEVRDYHRDTLLSVINEVNRRYSILKDKEKKEQQQQNKKREDHYRDIKDISNDIDF